MKAYWEFTDMVGFFTNMPLGVYIGGGLFATGIVILIVSGIAVYGKRKCSQKPKRMVDGDGTFENPVFKDDKQEKKPEKNDATAAVNKLEVKEDEHDELPDYVNTSETLKRSEKTFSQDSAIYVNETNLDNKTTKDSVKEVKDDSDSDDGYEPPIDPVRKTSKQQLAEVHSSSMDEQQDYVNVQTLKRV